MLWPRILQTAVALGFLAFPGAPLPAAEPPELSYEEATALLQEGTRAHAERRYEQAERIAREVLERADEPELHLSARNLLGISLLDQGEDEKIEQAAEIFRILIDETDGQLLQAYYNRAMALHYLQRDEEEGLALLRDLLTKEPPEELADRSRILLCGLKNSIGAADIPNPLPEGYVVEKEKVMPPSKIWTPAPQYTEEDRLARAQGQVILQAIVDREGCVQSMKILKGLTPGLEQSAKRSVRWWVFRPARLEGYPVSVYYNLTVNFSLKSRTRG